ncbi:MAG: bis(5'-nucleosyl)-tetraphosphatase (symmetrical) YqeK [bacterium]|nr:bis(5'-nucleosyl)-tetraphosphatase (symmetrical) YqeK [bacterium]
MRPVNDYRALAGRVRDHLGQSHRYAHVIRVARCAEVLAMEHGLDARKARLAGLLHDLARLYPGPRLLAECEARRLPVGAFEREHPIVLHAPLGAALASETFAVRDPEVLSAIAKHTVGAAEMSPLDCALYLADALEPGREYDERAELWALARRDLHGAMRAVIANSLRYLERKKIPVAPQTLAAAATFKVDRGEVPSLT